MNIKIFIKFIILLVFINISVYAETKIKLIGNDRITKDTILYYMGANKNSKFDDFEVDNILKKLYATGFFFDVKINKKDDGTVVVQVKENPIVKNLYIEGSSKIKDKELKKDLSTKVNQPYSEYKLKLDASGISSLYKRLGYFFNKVSYKVEESGKGFVDVYIKVRKGESSKVKEIKFMGNEKFSSKQLYGVLYSKKKAWYKPLSSEDLFNQDKVELDKELLSDFYQQHGYADFQVLSSNAEASPNGKYFLLNFLIKEGKVYKFGKTNFKCDNQLDCKDLSKFIPYKEGDIYNKTLIFHYIKDLKDFFFKKGYAFVDVDHNLVKSNGIVNLNFNIKKGVRVFVRNINISGNVRTIDRVIRRNILINEGDVFNISKIRDSKHMLDNLGFFKNVDISYNHKTDIKDKVDLNVNVDEMSTGSLGFSGGYNTAVGPIGSISFSEYNFLGKGQIIGFDFSKAKKNSDISFRFMEPRLNDRNLGVGFDVFMVSEDNNDESSFSSKNRGFAVHMEYMLNRYLHHSINYSFKNGSKSWSETASSFLTAQPNKSVSSSFGHTVTFDKLDNRIYPTTGYMIKFTQNFAGIGGNTKYIQNKLDIRYYKPLYSNNVIFHAIGRFGNIFGLGKNNVSVSDNFFIGEEYIRGFNVSGIGPRAKSNALGSNVKSLGDALGGKVFFSGTLETQFPLGLPDDFGIKGALFVDVATLYNTDAYKYPNSPSKDLMYDSKKLRASYGVGLLWNSPIGFIRVDYGVPFRKESFDRLHRIRLSIGANLN